MRIFVQTLEHAHLDACPLRKLHFDGQPTVREVLQRLQQSPQGVQVLVEGEDGHRPLALDDIVTDGSVVFITDQAAERMRQMRHAMEQRDRQVRDARAALLGNHSHNLQLTDKDLS